MKGDGLRAAAMIYDPKTMLSDNGGEPVRKSIIRYIGNPKTKEFHSLRRAKKECRLPEDTRKWPAFKRGRDAQKLNFDACAHCVAAYGYFKSRENT
jgi:hypothetical protein